MLREHRGMTATPEYIPVTVDGSQHYVREEAIDAFGVQSVPSGFAENGEPNEFEAQMVLTLRSGMQVPIDGSLDDFLASAAGR